MAYFTNLFSAETYRRFLLSDRKTAGYRETQHRVSALRPDDKLVCYVTRVSRWVGLLEVVEGPFREQTPIFTEIDDPYVLRFRVCPIVLLPIEDGVPIRHPTIWNALSFTRNLKPRSTAWAGKFLTSLVRLSADDGSCVETALKTQMKDPGTYRLPS